MLKVLLVVTALCCSLSALPLDDNSIGLDEAVAGQMMENPKLFEGDILLDSNTRFGHASEKYLWPHKTLVYDLGSLPYTLKMTIKKAMDHISTFTCIRFKQRTTEKHYVRFIKGNGCYSYVGYLRVGGQEVSLGRGCNHLGTVIHELMHAIGFFHQHSRSDRDNYLNIHWNNILYLFRNQFFKLGQLEGAIFTPFDYESIMLYGPRAFSKDGVSVTMSAKKPGVVLKNSRYKNKLSKHDALSINKLYNCA